VTDARNSDNLDSYEEGSLGVNESKGNSDDSEGKKRVLTDFERTLGDGVVRRARGR
jgi:hypothetical protein